MIPIKITNLHFTRGASSPYSACFIAMLLAVESASALRADVTSDFEVDADGWYIDDLPLALGNPPTVQNTYAVTYSSTGGNPGGHITMFDPSALWFHFAAPAKFLGDKSAYYGGRITYDMSTNVTDMAEYHAVILVGAGKALYYPRTWPQPTFTPFDIPLLPTGWKIGDYEEGAEPTADEMREVLADLDSLYIDGDWSSIDETTQLDNVRLLLPVPSPTVVNIEVKKKVLVGPASKSVMLKGKASANTVRVTVNGKLAKGTTNWKSRVKFPKNKKAIKIKVVATSNTGAITTRTVKILRRR